MRSQGLIAGNGLRAFHQSGIWKDRCNGTKVEKARYDFQAAYMLRGKIDNIFDMSIAELSKIQIVDDLSRIIGIAPGKRGTILPDRVLALTDADPDGSIGPFIQKCMSFFI